MASFSKKITKTDTEKRLSMPIKFLESLPPFQGGHAVEFQAKDENAEVWTFQCSTRKKGRYKKPVLSKGWLAFASRKKLKVGDRIEFYRARNQTTDESPFYGVRVEREVKLLGSRIGYSPLLSAIKPFSDFISHESRLPCFRPVQTPDPPSPFSF